MSEELELITENITKIIDDAPDDLPSTELLEAWLESCPFDYEFVDEAEGHAGEVCQWYFFRIQ